MLSSKEYEQIKTSLTLLADDNGNVPLDKCVQLLKQWANEGASQSSHLTYPPGVRSFHAPAEPVEPKWPVSKVKELINTTYDELKTRGANKSKLMKVISSKVGTEFDMELLVRLIDEKINEETA